MFYGDNISIQDIDVKYDPRLAFSKQAIEDKYTSLKKIEKYKRKISEIVNQLNESRKITVDYENKLTKQKYIKYENLISNSKSILKKIDTLLISYIGKVDKRQGITRSQDISVYQRLNIANKYIESKPENQTKTENQLIDQLKDSLGKAIQETNIFFTNEWVKYKLEIEKTTISAFKKTKSFSLN